MEGKKYIPIDDLRVLHDLVLDKTIEACGILELQSDNSLKLIIDNYGKKNGRLNCLPKRYTKWIWHTHPLTSKSYPSWEDIATVMKRRLGKRKYPVYSLIFTHWGIWNLYCPKGSNIEDKEKRYLSQVVDYCVKPLYLATGGRRPLDSSRLPDEFSECINKKLSKVNTTFRISFTPWKEVSGTGYVV